jgi:DNA-binding MarR family transcriptional regulator
MSMKGRPRPSPDLGLFLQLSVTNAMVSAAADRRLVAHGLPVVHLGLLKLITDNAPVTPSELERITGQASTTLRGRTQSLIRSGYVVRRPNAADGRSALLSTTSAGRRLLARAWPLVAALEAEVVATVLGDGGRLRAALQELAAVCERLE